MEINDELHVAAAFLPVIFSSYTATDFVAFRIDQSTGEKRKNFHLLGL
jgi:hypothetical protein